MPEGVADMQGERRFDLKGGFGGGAVSRYNEDTVCSCARRSSENGPFIARGESRGEMNKTTVLTATAIVPAESSARSLKIVTGTPVPATFPSAPAPQAVTKPSPTLQPIQYAAAVLKGQPHMLESVAECFVSKNARVRKNEEGWILESSEFTSCTTGEQVFPIADDIVSRLHRILALYCGTDEVLSVAHIYWINAAGEKLRAIRGVLPINVFSSRGITELKTMSGTQPLGSAVFQAMILDPTVNEALALHGESRLSWSQVYDIIEFLGGVDGIVKAGYANRKLTLTVRQTANHYRHLGSPKNSPLPPNPPALTEASEFVRTLLKCCLSSRL